MSDPRPRCPEHPLAAVTSARTPGVGRLWICITCNKCLGYAPSLPDDPEYETREIVLTDPSRPQFVRCIAKPYADERRNESLCGRSGRDWRFIGLDHVFTHSETQGRLLACPACVDVAIKVLGDARYDPAKHPDDTAEEGSDDDGEA